MKFITDFFRNLMLLLLIILIFRIAFPDMTNQLLEIYGAIFGPVAILILLAAALPRGRRNR